MTPEEWRMTPNKVGRTVYMPKLPYHGSREVTIQSVFKDTAIVKWQEIKASMEEGGPLEKGIYRVSALPDAFVGKPGERRKAQVKPSKLPSLEILRRLMLADLKEIRERISEMEQDKEIDPILRDNIITFNAGMQDQAESVIRSIEFLQKEKRARKRASN